MLTGLHGLHLFFLQAEDGIRDERVTGVQTCALPISGPFAAALHATRDGSRVQGAEEDEPHPTDALGRDAQEAAELSMGQKVNPIGFRLGVIRSWDSKWYEEKNYAKWLHEDIRLREYVKKKLGQAGISKVEIERAASKVKVNVHTARPGIVIGKRGADVVAGFAEPKPTKGSIGGRVWISRGEALPESAAEAKKAGPARARPAASSPATPSPVQ